MTKTLTDMTLDDSFYLGTWAKIFL